MQPARLSFLSSQDNTAMLSFCLLTFKVTSCVSLGFLGSCSLGCLLPMYIEALTAFF